MSWSVDSPRMRPSNLRRILGPVALVDPKPMAELITTVPASSCPLNREGEPFAFKAVDGSFSTRTRARAREAFKGIFCVATWLS